MLTRRTVMWALRIGAAGGLLFILAYHVDWRALPQQFSRMSWPEATLALLCLTTQFVVGPMKWRAALKMHHLDYDLPYLIRTYGVGMFFNNFLPSGMGGDAYRAMSTWPGDGGGSRAVSAVLIERMVGFGVLLAIGAVGALFMTHQSRMARTFVAIAVVAAIVLLIIVRAMHSGYMRNLSARLQHVKLVAAITRDLRYLKRGGARWLSLVAISVLFQAMAIASIYFLFKSLGVHMSLTACALIGAASGFATIIPISINGLGVVEGAFVGMALGFGAPYGAALAAALLMRILIVPQTLFFGLLYAVNGSKWPPRAAQTSAAAQ